MSGEVVGDAYVRREFYPRREGGEVGQDRFHRRKLRTYRRLAAALVGPQAEIDVALAARRDREPDPSIV